VKILVDHRERDSDVIHHLRERSIEIELVSLPLADYVLAPNVGVERKTVRDLHRSILDGRLWTQIASLRADLGRPYLVIEGVTLDGGRISRAGVRGAMLSVAELGVSILRSTDAADTALWLEQLARRSGRHASSVPRRSRHRPGVTAASVLASIPGISLTTARLLLDRFETVSSIATAEASELMTIPGIGERRAETLLRILRDSGRTDRAVTQTSGTSREARSAT
jgi:ERCC4-type nuclease